MQAAGFMRDRQFIDLLEAARITLRPINSPACCAHCRRALTQSRRAARRSARRRIS